MGISTVGARVTETDGGSSSAKPPAGDAGAGKYPRYDDQDVVATDGTTYQSRITTNWSEDKRYGGEPGSPSSTHAFTSRNLYSGGANSSDQAAHRGSLIAKTSSVFNVNNGNIEWKTKGGGNYFRTVFNKLVGRRY